MASVQSDSMTGTFERGDIIIGKLANEDTVIEKGDIVSFWDAKDGIKFVNTHRVVEAYEHGDAKFYDTKGDKEGLGVDPYTKSQEDILAVYQGKIPALGSFIDFIKKPIGFLLIIVLPFLIVIGWEVYRLIILFIEHKKQQILEEAGSSKQITDADKDAIIQEYLRKQQVAAMGAESKDTAEAEDVKDKE
jgi:signal peptidase